ncbi:MAG TPA: hypothetical protein VKE27_12295 [Candidatus Dormibacteraeota bacterium]|nr:hypothetical protein [Candidatus Dormibacteraeota bacterium]
MFKTRLKTTTARIVIGMLRTDSGDVLDWAGALAEPALAFAGLWSLEPRIC